MTSLHPVQDWLLAAESRGLPLGPFFETLAAKLRASGIAVSRMTSSVLTMHPEVFVLNLRWRLGHPAEVNDVPHSVQQTSDYVASPVEAIRTGSGPIRVRLAGVEKLPYPQLQDLRAQGGTDYFIQPLQLSSGHVTYLSCTTDHPDGFSDEALAALQQLAPAVALRLEIHSAHHATRSLLTVYLGRHAAERVLSGAFQRGTGEEIDAAIFFCDMRGFSTFSDSAPMRTVVATLDRYFECLAAPIASHGGEILKFIGDAVLAVFPIGGDAAAACSAAFASAREAIAAVDALGDSLARSGGPRVRAGVAVHRGRVLYGNIGAQLRLDFTVIGPAVNEAARIEALCKELQQPILVSDAVAPLLPEGSVRSAGSHALRGIKAPRELFVPAEP